MARAMFDQHKSVFEIFQENRRYKLDYKQYRILKQMGRVEEVENKYNSLLEKKRKYGNNTESIEYFYKLLMNKGV